MVDEKRYGHFETLRVLAPFAGVLHVELNRPKKKNAMNRAFWREMTACFGLIGADPEVRVVVLSGAGDTFSAGLDLFDHMGSFPPSEGTEQTELSRRANETRKFVQSCQESFSILERIPQPVIAAVNGGCIGGGFDLICTCDIRLAQDDAWFCIKEIDLAMVADVGTFPRISRIMGNESLVRELAFTGRAMRANEAKANGLLSHVFPNKETLMKNAFEMAVTIASKSPIGVFGLKHVLNHTRDLSVPNALQYVATWNMAMLQSADVAVAATAALQKQKPIFAKL